MKICECCGAPVLKDNCSYCGNLFNNDENEVYETKIKIIPISSCTSMFLKKEEK